MDKEKLSKRIAPVTDVVGDAVGMPKIYWFVAIVNHNSEKTSSEKLNKLGVETYLPTQTELRVWRNGRKSKVERVVMPSTLFIHCCETTRKGLVGLPFIFRFMTNKAGTPSKDMNKPLAIISDEEIDRLKFMLGQSDIPVEITEKPFKSGDCVRVIRGDLKGLEGEVLNLNSSKSELIVGLNFFGCAKLTIDTVNLELIK